LGTVKGGNSLRFLPSEKRIKASKTFCQHWQELAQKPPETPAAALLTANPRRLVDLLAAWLGLTCFFLPIAKRKPKVLAPAFSSGGYDSGCQKSWDRIVLTKVTCSLRAIGMVIDHRYYRESYGYRLTGSQSGVKAARQFQLYFSPSAKSAEILFESCSLSSILAISQRASGRSIASQRA